MDFSFTDEQLRRRDEVIAFAQAELNPDDLVEREQAGRFSRELWAKCAEFGLLGLNVPAEFGGQGLDAPTFVLMLEGLGYGCLDNGLPFTINSQLFSTIPAMLQFGNDAQKARYLPAMVSGEKIGVFGITERDSGSDTYSMSTRAEKRDDGYVLTGRKCYITSAPECDFAVIFANSNPDVGQWGISAFIVERGMDGFSTSPVRDKMGMRTTQMGDLILEDCFVPLDNRLGPEGAGVSMFTRAMESERGYIFASQVGALQRQLERAVEHARERKQFGEAIGKFQSVSNRIANMRLRLETARMLLHKVAWLEHSGQPLLMEAAMAKLHLSEVFVESSMDALRIHGARGYLTSDGIERDVRDGIGGLLYSGTSDIQRNIIARLLGI